MNNTCEELIKKVEALPRYTANMDACSCSAGDPMVEDDHGKYILRDVVLYIISKHTGVRLIG